MIDPEELKNVSLSHGTMKGGDLVDIFISALRQIDPENSGLMKSLDEIQDEKHHNPRYYSDHLQYDLDYLFDTLNELAPEGYYFGSHPGDGSDYGFWECEKDFDEEEISVPCPKCGEKSYPEANETDEEDATHRICNGCGNTF